MKINSNPPQMPKTHILNLHFPCNFFTILILQLVGSTIMQRQNTIVPETLGLDQLSALPIYSADTD